MFEEEILMNISDMIMNIYVLESTKLRVEKMEKVHNANNISLYKDMLDILTYDLVHQVSKSGFDAIGSFAEGEQYSKLSDAMAKLTKIKPINIKEARRRIADKLIDDGLYKF